MTTSNFDGNAVSYGLPSEVELEKLANQLFPDIDGSLFEPEVCAGGIEKLVTSVDTGIFATAENKAARVFGGQLGVQDFENILGELKQELSFDELSGLNSEYSGLADIGGGFRELEDFTAAHEYAASDDRNNKYTGYAPKVLSEQQALTGQGAEVRTTANDHNVIPAKDNHGVDFDTVGGQKGNVRIVVGTKTLEQIRRDFPILQEKVNGNPLIWLDNGATTQRPRQVIDRLSYYYEHENSNVHRGAHTLAAKSTDAFEGARQTVADFIGAPSKDNVVFVRGTTEGINLVAQSFVKPLL